MTALAAALVPFCGEHAGIACCIVVIVLTLNALHLDVYFTRAVQTTCYSLDLYLTRH